MRVDDHVLLVQQRVQGVVVDEGGISVWKRVEGLSEVPAGSLVESLNEPCTVRSVVLISETLAGLHLLDEEGVRRRSGEEAAR